MAINVKNIVVGAANVFFSVGTTTVVGRPVEPAVTAASSMASYLRSIPASWNEAGLTSEGVDISYEPGYGEVMVDQLLDVAKIFKQTLKVTAKTTLNEATLGNLEVAFGNEGSIFGSASSVTMSLAAGALGVEPVERGLVFVSQSVAQANVGTTPTLYAASAAGVTSTGANERVYYARRVVSMDTVAHSMKRDAATMFPVTFRLLPDTDYTGSEYGKIIDRVYQGTGFTG